MQTHVIQTLKACFPFAIIAEVWKVSVWGWECSKIRSGHSSIKLLISLHTSADLTCAAMEHGGKYVAPSAVMDIGECVMIT